MSKLLHIHQLSDHAQNHEREADTPLVDAVLLVPSAGVSCFELNDVDIPKRYLKQALPSLLEDKLIEPLDELHISYTAAAKTNSLHIIVARNQTVQEWLDAALASGINPTAIVPDFYGLPTHNDVTSVSFDGDYGCVRTGLHNGFSGRTDEVCALLKFSATDNGIHLYGDSTDSLAALQNVILKDNNGLVISSDAINLRHGIFANKRTAGNPYAPYRWPLALSAALLLSMSLHFQLEARFLKAENLQLNKAVAADYKTVFKQVIEPNWQAAARYQTALARQQLSEQGLDSWRLLRHLNETLASCSNCVIEEFSLNQQGVLLTIKTNGSAALIAAIKASSALKLGKQQAMESNTTLAINLDSSNG